MTPTIQAAVLSARAFPHSSAAILSIGDELVRGQTLDTNSKWLSARLMDLGIETVEHATIADDRAATMEAIRRLACAAPLVIVTGGLGPTADDLTRDALADVLGEELVEDADALAALDARLNSRGRVMTEAQRLQALRPRTARCLANANGTAPGLHAVISAGGGGDGAADLLCLPGPPGELIPMFEASVVPMLRPPTGVVVRTRSVTVTGLPEAEATSRVPGLMARDRNPLVGITASGGLLTFRLRYRGAATVEQAETALAADDAVIRAALGACVFGDGARTLAADVIARLTAAGKTLGVVESCTGGMLGQMLTAVPGASRAFVGGLLTYSNESKTRLASVPAALITEHGAVSAAVARAMAVGGQERLGASYVLAITGLAGPDGGSADKPVGLVYVALASPPPLPHGSGVSSASTSVTAGTKQASNMGAICRRFLIPGGRDDVRQRSAVSALSMLHFAIGQWGNSSLAESSEGPRRLLWEQAGAGVE